MKTTTAITLFLFACSSFLRAQTDGGAPDYILRKGQDTMFCYVTTVVRSAGNVSVVKYLDKAKVEQTIKGKDEIENIVSMRVGGYVMDYLPLKADKPDGYKRHIEVSVNGKIKVYDHIRFIASTDKKGKRELFSVVGAGSEFSFFKLENGKLYELSKKNTETILLPHLNKCSEFKSGFKEEVNWKTVRLAVKYYNEHCGEE